MTRHPRIQTSMAADASSVALLAGSALVVVVLSWFCASSLHLVVPAGAFALLVATLRWRDGETHRRACVLVLGDLGRSPRMQYHASSLSKHGYDVTFVGFLDSKPHDDIVTNKKIRIAPISEVRGVSVGPRLLKYASKVLLQVLQLLLVLLTMKRQALILLQNPPGLPAMAVVWLVSILRGSSFVMDWHNYGFTIMALSLGAKHPLVRLAERYERFFGPLATQNLCVTEAMKDDLKNNWKVKATTLYDRPAAVFWETQLPEQHELFRSLGAAHPVFLSSRSEEDGGKETTAFTVKNLANQSVTLRPDRPALLVSSTSWTEDEDFSVLLGALEEYDELVMGGAPLPHLLCVITGKGPLKTHYCRQIDSLQLQHVHICTPWLEAEDYPRLLGSADLGVCLHKSSSGLDLPMKVVDMFGCCLPVCAVHYHCLQELVQPGVNGLVFRDQQQLAAQLKSLLEGFPGSCTRLDQFRRNLRASRGQRWDDNWDQNVLPLISAH
ncbi:chitobiosyldiphosphodolichol beta-mannosyltransferase isoform X1 [Synchiropus splendidus]|uniref:chitobiosyldiphosphodolichol beta-mannosyltransferase isoform X1 n=1 Tax=Synchiropus splendidus TaxID=270530 RepID=UPI00237D334C|nr:chitobiosyldiphosphodolichol beta-mannosyltransferase isoform X1 [Synchiropus splendidus]